MTLYGAFTLLKTPSDQAVQGGTSAAVPPNGTGTSRFDSGHNGEGTKLSVKPFGSGALVPSPVFLSLEKYLNLIPFWSGSVY